MCECRFRNNNHNHNHNHHHHHHNHHQPPPGASHRVVVEGLSGQSVRPLWGLTGEARSRPGVTVAGGPRGLQGQRDESDDGRHSLGSCCPEDLSVACRPPSGELTHGPADPGALYSDTAVNITSVWGGAREPQSGFPDGAGWKGRLR